MSVIDDEVRAADVAEASPRRRAARARIDLDAARTKGETNAPRDKIALRLYLRPETDAALRVRAEEEGLTLTALGERALVSYLSHEAAGQVAQIAAPAIEEAVARRVDDLLRTLVVQPLSQRLEAIHQEVAVARLEGYAHFGNDYGPDEAQRLEAVAMERATAARKAGTMAQMYVRVENATP